jgi:hypothetical protein
MREAQGWEFPHKMTVIRLSYNGCSARYNYNHVHAYPLGQGSFEAFA